MYKHYEMTFWFQTKLMAALPADPEAIVRLMEQNNRPELTDEVIEALPEIPDGTAKISDLVFMRDAGGGLCMGGYTVKAHLKDCARLLAKIIQQKWDVKSFRSKMADRVYVIEDLIPIMREGRLHEPDGRDIRTGTVMSALGPRQIVKRHECVNGGARITFNLRVLDDGVIKREMLEMMLEYGSLHGYGGERGMGCGRYRWELREIAIDGEQAAAA